MITNICLLLEELSVLLCIHYLYGEKFKLDIKTTSYLAVYMIIMSAINYYDLPRICTVVTYPLIYLYCGFKFGWKWKTIVINFVLYIVIVGGVQLIVATCFGRIFNVKRLIDEELLIVNSVVFVIVLLILPHFKVNKLSSHLQDQEKILVISLILCIIFTVARVISYKIIKVVEAYQYIPLFCGIALIFILAGQLGKYKIKSKEMETELKMHQLYAESFHNLIQEIRMRQHEFDNHINTIYSLHYTCKSYRELVNAQREYSSEILKENRHNKLLTNGNPLLIGFLYGKIIEIEKYGINISYRVKIKEMNVGVPIFKLVEIIGNLLKNATEALLESKEFNLLFIAIMENDDSFEIEVRNESKFIDFCEIESFFKKGYSKKGENRGLGLYNVKAICNDYSLKLCCKNKMIDDKNWLWFSVSGIKEAT